jgi:hypothetical protein
MHAQLMDGPTSIARLGILAGLTSTAIALGACLGPAGTPTISVGEVTTLRPSPTSSATGLAAPEIPARFPVMAGIEVDEPLPDAPGLIGRWTTAANGADVYTFLADALLRAGYHVDLLAPGDTVAVIRFTPPGGRQLQIDLGQEGSGTFMELRLPRD